MRMTTNYLMPGMMTGAGRHAAGVPGDLAGVVRAVQGLFIHEFWGGSYGVSLSDADRATAHIRPAADLLDRVGDRPLTEARAPADRIPVSCRSFSVVSVALLRAHGIPARVRCGYATYFTPGFFESHWVIEYRDGERWKLADAQLDEVQRHALGVGFDPLDLPRDQFLTAVDAWRAIRAGEADPQTFGLPGVATGEGFVAGDVVHDIAALGNVETLPWDGWPPMPDPGEDFERARFDRIAAGQEAVTVPARVFNARRGRLEALTSAP
jgi:hypothetical protein